MLIVCTHLQIPGPPPPLTQTKLPQQSGPVAVHLLPSPTHPAVVRVAKTRVASVVAIVMGFMMLVAVGRVLRCFQNVSSVSEPK